MEEIQLEQVVPIGNNVPVNIGNPLVWETVWKHWPPIKINLDPRPADGNTTYLCNPGIQQEFAK